MADNEERKKRSHTLEDHLLGIDAMHEHDHEDGEADHDHDHDDVGGEYDPTATSLWAQDNISLLSVGIDIGSAGTQIIFSRVRLPSALPAIFGGMKVSITLAVVGAIVGDFIAAENGIGRLLLSANGNMDTELLFAGILALVAVGVILFLLMEALEKLALPWHVSQRAGDAGRH